MGECVFMLMIYLMYWIKFMNFIYVIHLMCWNYLIALIDLITHSRNRNNRNNSIHCNNKGGARLSARPLCRRRPHCCFRCFCFCCV